MPSVDHLSSVASKPPGENISSGAPLPIISYRVTMPSIAASAKPASFRRVSGLARRSRRASQLPPRADVVAQGSNGRQRVRRDVRVPLGLVVDRRRQIAERREERSHAAVEPGSAAQAADHGNADGARNGGSRRRSPAGGDAERRAPLPPPPPLSPPLI